LPEVFPHKVRRMGNGSQASRQMSRAVNGAGGRIAAVCVAFLAFPRTVAGGGGVRSRPRCSQSAIG
jgi:hypothetical protein